MRILTEPQNALVDPVPRAPRAPRVSAWTSREDAVREIARLAAQVNDQTENIGARRLATILETVLDEVSFEAGGTSPFEVTIDSAYVRRRLDPVVQEPGPLPLHSLMTHARRLALPHPRPRRSPSPRPAGTRAPRCPRCDERHRRSSTSASPSAARPSRCPAPRPGASVDGVAFESVEIEFFWGEGQIDLEKAGRQRDRSGRSRARASSRRCPCPPRGRWCVRPLGPWSGGNRGQRTLILALEAQPPLAPPHELTARLRDKGVALSWQGPRPEPVDPPDLGPAGRGRIPFSEPAPDGGSEPPDPGTTRRRPRTPRDPGGETDAAVGGPLGRLRRGRRRRARGGRRGCRGATHRATHGFRVYRRLRPADVQVPAQPRAPGEADPHGHSARRWAPPRATSSGPSAPSSPSSRARPRTRPAWTCATSRPRPPDRAGRGAPRRGPGGRLEPLAGARSRRATASTGAVR